MLSGIWLLVTGRTSSGTTGHVYRVPTKKINIKVSFTKFSADTIFFISSLIQYSACFWENSLVFLRWPLSWQAADGYMAHLFPEHPNLIISPYSFMIPSFASFLSLLTLPIVSWIFPNYAVLAFLCQNSSTLWDIKAFSPVFSFL